MRLNGDPSKRASSSAFSKASRAIWLRLPYHQASMHVIKNHVNTPVEIILNLTRGNSPGTLINLTRLTHAELLALREVILIATEVAEPLVLAADENARKAADNGDDSDDRVYRGLPTLVVRRTVLPVGTHSESVLDRHKDVFRGVGGQILSGNRTEQSGSGVASVVEGDEEAGSDDGEAQEG